MVVGGFAGFDVCETAFGGGWGGLLGEDGRGEEGCC